jgi:hypothetical protein
MIDKLKRWVYLIFPALAVCLVCSCRKESIPVDGVEVELWTQQIEGGIFTANYVLAGTTSTGNDGKFGFVLEKANYTGIRLNFNKKNYFVWVAELNMEEIKNDQSYYAEYQLLPKAWLKIRVKNNEPFGLDDYFEFRILNGYSGCEECCKGEKYQFTGMDIDETIDCQMAGHQEILIQWSMRKNGEQIIRTDSYFIKAFETTGIELIY